TRRCSSPGSRCTARDNDGLELSKYVDWWKRSVVPPARFVDSISQHCGKAGADQRSARLYCRTLFISAGLPGPNREGRREAGNGAFSSRGGSGKCRQARRRSVGSADEVVCPNCCLLLLSSGEPRERQALEASSSKSPACLRGSSQ